MKNQENIEGKLDVVLQGDNGWYRDFTGGRGTGIAD